MQRIVYVCSGNICRSPMAVVIGRAAAAQRGIPVVIISCGTLGLVGKAAASNAVTAVAEIGLDLSDHYSQGVSLPLVRMADHIVVMAPRHEKALLELDITIGSKIVRMWEFAADEYDQIDDPVNQDLDAFRVCRDLLVECMDSWMDTIAE